MNYQKTVIVGNVGKKEDMHYTPSGHPVTTFSVAVNEKWATGEKTTWYRVSAWNKLAELCNQYVTKGMEVLVEGKAEASAYTTQSGEVRASLDLRADNVQFGKGGEQQGQPAQRNEYGEEDVPF